MEGKVITFLIFILLLGIIFIPSAHSQEEAHILIYEVSPYPYSGTHMEYICLYNPNGRPVNLDDYLITDLEGYLNISGYISSHSKIYIAENSTAFFRFMGFYPQFVYSEIKIGNFALSNGGDEVILLKGNEKIDVVIYGDSKYNESGWIGKPMKITQGHILRRISINDTDTPEDWTNYHIIAQSDFQPHWFQGTIEIFPYPDEWREVIRFLRDAKEYLFIESYTIDSTDFEEMLLSKLKEGVKVSILLEGNPVGGINSYEKSIVHTLWINGANIEFMINAPQNDTYDRYRYIHSKFIIKDDREVLISTENFGHSSLTPCGNRGYGIIVKNDNFARYMKDIYLDDKRKLQDIKQYNGEFSNITVTPLNKVELRKKVFRSINITAKFLPIIAPDFAPLYFKRFIDDQRTLDIEALYVDDNIWSEIKNKSKRVLIEYGNLRDSVKFFDGLNHYIKHLHAKLIIGDSAVLVGSMNLGISSMYNNREVSLWIAGEDAVKYFERVFEYDWKDEYKPIVVAKIQTNGREVRIDLSKSIGEISSYYVYLGGDLVYKGKKGKITIYAASGKHSLMIIIEDKWGNRDMVREEIEIKDEYRIDWRIPIILIILAIFLYKVWKDHG
ncbi:phospholipase [Euryarchaeota archaeon ex4484_178]|nr:MAG: phospholipase [Euryarchaeota archaeon ex4484_178]